MEEPPPDADELDERLRSSLRTRARGAAAQGAVLTFDDHGSPWHTRCVVRPPTSAAS